MQSFKVLVVEDFEPFRQFICSLLRARAEFQVTEATDGLEAVQKAKQLQPDCILLDLGLPNLNGIEVCKCAGELAPAAKIIFLSQESSTDVVERCLIIAQGYIQKLHASRDLLPAIEAALKGEHFVSSGLLIGKKTNSREWGISEYPWHEMVMDALQASPDSLSTKICAAEGVILARLKTRPRKRELFALAHALHTLAALFERATPQNGQMEKNDVA
jgi:DNA-binding NarL/FixJ family response regulator